MIDRKRKENGITLVSLIVTIIILMILAGIGLMLIPNLFGKRIDAVASEVAEATLEEKIEMAWMDTEASYWLDKKSTPLTKLEYFEQNLEKKLEELVDIDEATVSGNIDEDVKLEISYKGVKYYFEISKSGGVQKLDLLKGNVKIADYIKYPVEYTDTYSGEKYTSINGWRVIDDGVMEGTSGYVRIISTGIPARWYYDVSKTSESAIESLTEKFQTTLFLNGTNDGSEILGSSFIKENIGTKATILSLSEMNQIYTACYGKHRENTDVSLMEDSLKLFNLQRARTYFYWLVSGREDSSMGLYNLSSYGIEYEDFFSSRLGIRPVVYLKEGLIGTFEDNIWKIKD